jgi:hypothetical protein
LGWRLYFVYITEGLFFDALRHPSIFKPNNLMQEAHIRMISSIMTNEESPIMKPQ